MMRPGFSFAAGLGTAAILCALTGRAWPQSVSATPDLTGIIAQSAAAKASADAATTAAAAAQAAIPQPCALVPAADTLLGSVGSVRCYARPDDTRPTSVQAAIATTDASGNWTVSWAKPFASADPYINPQPVNPSALQPVTCNVTSSSATQVSGRCWLQNVMTTPGVSLSLLNLQLVGAASSIQVRVAGRDRTQ